MTVVPVRVVYDCQVHLQAALSDTGPATRCLRAAELGLVQLWVSDEIMCEVSEVLCRPELRRRFSRLTPELVGAFLAQLTDFVVFVTDVPGAFRYPRDPDDEPYVDLAIAARATYLVTRDRDLLDLQGSDTTDAEALRQLAPGLTILDPIDFLDEVL